MYWYNVHITYWRNNEKYIKNIVLSGMDKHSTGIKLKRYMTKYFPNLTYIATIKK